MNRVDWALTRDISAPPKLLLVTLAWISDEAGVTFKAQKTIAARVGKDPRWIREHLPKLAAAGFVTRYRRHRVNGERTTDLIVLNVPRDEPLDLDGYSGIVGAREPGDIEPSGGNPPGGLVAETREPSGGNPPTINQPPNQPAKGNIKSASARADAFPDDLPADLHDVAIAAGRILKAAAIERGQTKEVTRRTVGHAVLSYPDRDHVQVAREVEAWVLDGRGAGKPCGDIVARYRNFLRNADPRPGPPIANAGGRSRPVASTGSARLRAMAADLRREQ